MGAQAPPREDVSLQEGQNLERKDGRDGPSLAPAHHSAPMVNEARPFSQEPPLGDSRARLPLLLQQPRECAASSP